MGGTNLHRTSAHTQGEPPPDEASAASRDSIPSYNPINRNQSANQVRQRRIGLRRQPRPISENFTLRGRRAERAVRARERSCHSIIRAAATVIVEIIGLKRMEGSLLEAKPRVERANRLVNVKLLEST
jgi:hypothetical protein